MKLALALRLVAASIAIAGVVDPAWILPRPVRQPVAIVVVDSDEMSLPAGSMTRRTRALAVADAMRDALADDYDVVVSVRHVNDSASACPESGPCLVVGAGSRPQRLTAGATVIGGVSIDGAINDNIAITAVAASSANLAGLGVVNVDLSAAGIAGGSTDVAVYDGAVLVGRAAHKWTPGTSPQVQVRVRVDWIPAAAGARRLHVVATHSGGEATTVDNEADVAAAVTDRPEPVLIYEPHPTWLAAFVRRALEGDPRFALSTRATIAGGIAVSAGVAADLSATSLAAARAVIVGAPERLTAAQVDLLDAYVRRRGGTVVLLPDVVPGGPVLRLLPAQIVERREREAIAIGELRASEVLTFGDRSGGLDVLARAADRPAVVVRPIGAGRVIVSGALDAWRYRSDAFDRFWRSAIADAVDATGTELHVDVTPDVVKPGEPVRVSAARRSMTPAASTLGINAILRCDAAGAEFIRLWPSGVDGRFEGTFRPSVSGACRVDVAMTADDGSPVLTASAPLVMAADAKRPVTNEDEFAAAVRAHGGDVVPAERANTLVARVRERAAVERAPQPSYPMRSPWWALPFALCLAGEWWQRRRRGLR